MPRVGDVNWRKMLGIAGLKAAVVEVDVDST